MPAAPLGLTTYRWNNNIKSALLLAVFPFLLLALVWVIFYCFGQVYNGPQGVKGVAFAQFGLREFFLSAPGTPTPATLANAAVYAYWPGVISVAALWVTIGFFFNDSIIHLATGAQAVARKNEPKLYNILENLCIARGLATPKLYVIDTSVLNAYASGIDRSSYAITVTRGLLDKLSDQEIEAVLGHELSHIINRDCRLLIVTVVFTGMISFLAQMLWRSIRLSLYSREGNGGARMAVLLLIAAVATFVGYLLALVLRLALSRRREYMADAGSVELTKNPQALITALEKISADCALPDTPSEVQQMFIENPPSALDLGGLFATHPRIEDRIRVLRQLGGLPPPGPSMIPNSG